MKKQSQIDIGITQDTNEENQLQRTEQWHKQRNGNWTSSIKKQLMSCGQSSGRKSWNEKSKVYDFGKTALKAIYNAAMARRTGRYIDKGDGTAKMKYGTRVEPLIFAIAKEMLASKGVLTEVGFKYFDDVPTAGVSADGVLLNNKILTKTLNTGISTTPLIHPVIATYEAKATTNWETHFDRTFDRMDEKGTDFWQTQDHMTAYNVDVCYYAVSEPPHDINKYLYYDGDIMDLLSDFREECKVSIQEIQASEMHQKAGLKRIEIAEAVIKIWNEEGDDLRRHMYNVIDEFKADHLNPDNYHGDVALEESLIPHEESIKVTGLDVNGNETSQIIDNPLPTPNPFVNKLQIKKEYEVRSTPKYIEVETGFEFPTEPIKTEVNPEDLPF